MSLPRAPRGQKRPRIVPAQLPPGWEAFEYSCAGGARVETHYRGPTFKKQARSVAEAWRLHHEAWRLHANPNLRCRRNMGDARAACPAGAEAAETEDEERCAACGIGTWTEGNWLLLCDGPGCDKAYHTLCLSPPLSSVPDDEWLCPSCAGDEDEPVRISAP